MWNGVLVGWFMGRLQRRKTIIELPALPLEQEQKSHCYG